MQTKTTKEMSISYDTFFIARYPFSMDVPNAKSVQFNIQRRTDKGLARHDVTQLAVKTGKICSKIIFNEIETPEVKFHYYVLYGL